MHLIQPVIVAPRQFQLSAAIINRVALNHCLMANIFYIEFPNTLGIVNPFAIVYFACLGNICNVRRRWRWGTRDTTIRFCAGIFSANIQRFGLFSYPVGQSTGSEAHVGVASVTQQSASVQPFAPVQVTLLAFALNELSMDSPDTLVVE